MTKDLPGKTPVRSRAKKDPLATDLVPSLRVIDSPDAALIDHLARFTSTLTIGRASGPGIGLVIEDESLSRAHVQFVVSDPVSGLTQITDLQSTNGTLYNGIPVTTASLAPGDLVQVGDTLLFFERVPLVPAPELVELIGRAQAMQQLAADLVRVSASALPVLILGETGTGKEGAARSLHRLGGSDGDFRHINCATLRDSLSLTPLERKNGGTLFLDEISDLAPELQASLVPFSDSLESSSPAVRLVASSHDTNLTSAKLRPDLYSRLSMLTLKVPPVRERSADIVQLLRHFLQHASPGFSAQLDPTARVALIRYPWPGNVREIRSVAEKIALRRPETITLADLPEPVQDAARRGLPADPLRPSRSQIENVLTRMNGNVARVAEHYGKERRQIYRWLEHYRIDAARFRRADQS